MSRYLPVSAACVHSSRFSPLIIVVVLFAVSLTGIQRSAIWLETLGKTTSGRAATPEGSAGFSHKGVDSHLTECYGKLPLSFEINRGQADSRVKFISRANGYAMFLTATETVLAVYSRTDIL